MASDIKWATRQRLEYIEVMAYYTGLVTRSDVANAFGLSDAAATKDLKLYSDLAPNNLLYKHSQFGFVPSEQFSELFADLSPRAALNMLASNMPVMNGPDKAQDIFGVSVDSLPLPSRLPERPVLAQIIRAIKNRKKLEVRYYSMSEQGTEAARILEPHSLINTGQRWHVRAYNEQTYDFRDFVLSRFVSARMLEQAAESSAMYDDDWMEIITLKLGPHPGLSEQRRHSLSIDFSMQDDLIELQVRRALVGYVLQRLSVDTTSDHSMNPHSHQLIVMNRDEVEPFAGWAFL